MFLLFSHAKDKMSQITFLGARAHTWMTGASMKTLCAQVFCQHEDLHGDDLLEFGGLEFPQINYGRCNTKPYRYFYGCGFRHLVGDSLLKMDLKDKTLKVCVCVCSGTWGTFVT